MARKQAAASGNNCGNCACWNKLTPKLGECRRYPPGVISADHLTEFGPLAKFNITPLTLSCYEHIPVPTPPPAE